MINATEKISLRLSVNDMERLEMMCLADETDRSEFIRQLIRKEFKRRCKKK